MPTPIYRVIIHFGFKKKGSSRSFVSKKIDTFALTNVEEDIKSDQNILERIGRKAKRKLTEIDIVFNKIEVEGRYGETNN